MTGRRRVGFSRLASARWLGVAVVALLVIGAIVSSLTPVSVTVGGGRKPSAVVTASPRVASHASRGATPVSVTGLVQARAVARAFAEGYLSVAYGQAPENPLTGATAALRAQLARSRVSVTPAERERHPRVVSMRAVGQEPGFALVTAWVSDGGISTYALRITVQEGPSGWFVSDVVDG